MKHTNKTERIYLRVSSEEKEQIKANLPIWIWKCRIISVNRLYNQKVITYAAHRPTFFVPFKLFLMIYRKSMATIQRLNRRLIIYGTTCNQYFPEKTLPAK